MISSLFEKRRSLKFKIEDVKTFLNEITLEDDDDLE
jgi:hypothetical protein